MASADTMRWYTILFKGKSYINALRVRGQVLLALCTYFAVYLIFTRIPVFREVLTKAPDSEALLQRVGFRDFGADDLEEVLRTATRDHGQKGWLKAQTEASPERCPRLGSMVPLWLHITTREEYQSGATPRNYLLQCGVQEEAIVNVVGIQRNAISSSHRWFSSDYTFTMGSEDKGIVMNVKKFPSEECTAGTAAIVLAHLKAVRIAYDSQ